MLSNLTFNQLVVPLVMACLFALASLGFWVKVRIAAQKAAQLEKLNKLNPPQKGHNHRSLPPRQYYLTRNMTKPTAAEEHLLEVYEKLHPEQVRPPQTSEKK